MRIVPYPHPALRYPSVPVTRFDDELRGQIQAMFALMYENEGIGLAANQVALPYQFFILNISGNPEQTELEQVFINPQILRKQATAQDEEGCLSFPGLHGKVLRPRRIKVRAWDQYGEPFELEADELLARAIQHEWDHLHGRLFIDKFSTLGRINASKKLKAFEAEFRAAQERGEYPSDEEIVRQLDALAALQSATVAGSA